MLLGAIFLVLLLPLDFFMFLTGFITCMIGLLTANRVKKKKLGSYSPQLDTTVFRDDFLLVGTDYHQEESQIAADFLSTRVHYFVNDHQSL